MIVAHVLLRLSGADTGKKWTSSKFPDFPILSNVYPIFHDKDFSRFVNVNVAVVWTRACWCTINFKAMLFPEAKLFLQYIDIGSDGSTWHTKKGTREYLLTFSHSVTSTQTLFTNYRLVDVRVLICNLWKISEENFANSDNNHFCVCDKNSILDEFFLNAL